MAQKKPVDEVYLIWLPGGMETPYSPAFILAASWDDAVKKYLEYHGKLSGENVKIIKIKACLDSGPEEIGKGRITDTKIAREDAIWKRAYELNVEKKGKKK